MILRGFRMVYGKLFIIMRSIRGNIAITNFIKYIPNPVFTVLSICKTCINT